MTFVIQTSHSNFLLPVYEYGSYIEADAHPDIKHAARFSTKDDAAKMAEKLNLVDFKIVRVFGNIKFPF